MEMCEFNVLHMTELFIWLLHADFLDVIGIIVSYIKLYLLHCY